MAAHAIHKNAAEAQMHPREWLLEALNKHGSQHQLAAHLGLAPNSVGRALCQYKIMELKYYRFRSYRHEVIREWMREGDLLRRRDWNEVRPNRLAGDIRD